MIPQEVNFIDYKMQGAVLFICEHVNPTNFRVKEKNLWNDLVSIMKGAVS